MMNPDELREKLIPKFEAIELSGGMAGYIGTSHQLYMVNKKYYLAKDVDAWFASCEVLYGPHWTTNKGIADRHARLAAPPIEIKEKSREERAVELLRKIYGFGNIDQIREMIGEIGQFLKEGP